MNLSPAFGPALNAAGFHAMHWSALGDPRAGDLDIMAFARAHDYVVVTHDLDFSAILAATNGEKPSVVQIRAQNLAPQLMTALLVAALRQSETALQLGALLTIDAERRRLRLLPLSSARPGE